jgi:hypothetical protein
MKVSRLMLLFVAGAGTLAFAQANPVPFVNQPLVPLTVAPGSQSFTLTVNGTGFVPGAAVNWNGAPLTTTFVSSSQLTATVPDGNVAKAGTASVTVVNPATDGALSNIAFFQISNPTSPAFTSFSYALASNLQTPQFVLTPVAADFNRDGNLDFLIPYNTGSMYLDDLGGSLLLFLGNGDGSFRTQAVGGSGGIEGLGVYDFNRDGKLDITVDVADPHFQFYFLTMLGNGDGTFQNSFDASSLQAWTSKLLLGDFNGDGKLDIAAIDHYAETLYVLLGNGDGTFQNLPPMVLQPLGVTFCGGVGDYNKDGKLDLLACSPQGEIAVVPGNGDGTFQNPSNFFPIGFSPLDVTAADFNGDGNLDLVAVQNASAGSVAVLLGKGDGTFQPAVTYPVGMDPVQVLTSDFNLDGKLDLALPGAGNLYILFGNGDGTFQAPQVFPAFAGPGALGDFDQDGTPDLAMQYTAPNNTSLSVEVLLQHTPQSDFSPANLAFGSQAVNIPSSPQKITFSNDGTTALTIISIRSGGNFSETNSCGSGLAPNAICTINVTFTPSAFGARQNFLTITDNAPGSPHALMLTGTGTDFTVTPNSQTSVTVTPGQAANYSVLVDPVDGFNQAVALTCSGAPAQSTCTISPSSITLDGVHTAPAAIAVVSAGSSAALKPSLESTHSKLTLALAMLGGVLGFLVPGGGAAHRKPHARFLGGLFILCLGTIALTVSACGGSRGGGGTPTGTYNLTVTGSFGAGSATLTHSTNFTLIVH